MRHDGKGKLFTARASTEGQLAAALEEAFSAERRDHLAFIEVCVDTDDCSKELLEFGARVGHANGRWAAGLSAVVKQLCSFMGNDGCNVRGVAGCH